MKILIAEDEPVPRFLLENALTEWGYEVVSAADGDEAWRLLQSPNAPKIAVFDWMMPGVDGPGLCRRLRAQATSEPTYVILRTSLAAKSEVVAGLQAGANDYVTKPFDREERGAHPGRAHGGGLASEFDDPRP